MLEATGKVYDIEKIKSAFEYAKALHEGQFRASGEAYISHPIAVAEIVAGLELDTDSICAALLHDTVEDCSDRTDLKIIAKKFGAEVASLVDGLTKIVTINVDDMEEAHIENLRKMLLAMSKDIRVIFIKLCDRLHNMRTLDAKPDNKRRLTALETMQVYAPLAHRLGMQKIKAELENLGLQYLDPIGYNEVKESIEKKYGQSLEMIEKIRADIEKKLKESNLKFTLEGRIKSVYSIYKKMYNQNKSFDEIYDFYALRIIVDTELECYTALGLIHEMYKSVPGRFKDYISTPKPNMYSSLHTTVIGTDGIPFEVQIRTWKMHYIAEYGIAAHWKYKSGVTSKEEMDRKLEWIARLVEIEDGTRDPDEFMNALKTDIFHDEVFVFTPKGEVIQLAQGSTVIDFAYAIHSEVGNKMIGAKINGMIVPIDRILQNGEIIEILTSSASKGPSRDWLNLVKTSDARNKIRSWFKKEKRADNIVAGKAMLDAEIRSYARNITEATRTQLYTALAQRVGYSSADDLCNTLGYGGITVHRLATRLKEEYAKLVPQEAPKEQVTDVSQIQLAQKPHKTHSRSSVIVDGQDGCQVKFAKCCNPLPGDEIIGFVTKGYGISIHKKDCPNVVSALQNGQMPERWLHAVWDTEDAPSGSEYEALVQIYATSSLSLLSDITRALAELKVSILQINSNSKGQEQVMISMKIACKDVNHYEYIVKKLRELDGIQSVTRGFS
ncbi:MAG: bifunctional (p)ppGpp synthetase/guanosine-3',5'-bis(diphosphate) 3'-pyrophosphohydrolase [Clostridia bacterium]|nr:bifunctional (p)ppGpp synthetase/guanosine-3',5'-bis(diphosphate) 3'-pyrophosphohydrolase [Clostridia bacterium]